MDRLHHLFFVEDSLFFMKGTVQNIQTLWSIINTYCAASGQGVNMSNSSFLISNANENDVKELEETMGIKSV